MVQVEFLGPIGLKPIEADVANLKELSQLLKKKKEVKAWLENCAVAVNDEITKDIEKELKSGDKVTLLPPVCGG